MSLPVAPESDPYFCHEGKDAKMSAAGEELARLELLPNETMIRVAGLAAMILGASVFLLFGIPVTGMLWNGYEPGGIFLTEGWKWDRWVARMVAILTMSSAGTVMGWGLASFRPWSCRVLFGLSALTPVSLVAGMAVRTWRPELEFLGYILGLTFLVSYVFPASSAVFFAALRTRAVFSLEYMALIGRTQQVTVSSRRGMMLGLGLAVALLIELWMILFLILGFLVVCGVIRTV